MTRVSAPALAFALVFLLAPPAAAQDSVAQEIADHLERSPVLVDPAYQSAFPDEAQEEIVDLIEDSDMPLRLIVVPLTDGDTWDGDPDNLARIVHDRMGGGEGHYLVLDNDNMHGQDYGGGTDNPAHFAALTSSYATEFDGGMRELIEVSVETALSDDPEGAYDAALAAYREDGPAPPMGGGMAPAWLWPAVAALALLLVAGLVWRVLRARGAFAQVPNVAQHAAFDNADLARLESLVERGARDLVELGERMSRRGAHPEGVEGTRLAQRALDARSAAARVHDRMLATEPTLPDAVGVLVLLDIAEDAFAMSRSTSVEPRVHCYANPLHGTRTKRTDWREFGGTRSVTVPLCAACARAVRDRRRPTVLPAHHGGREVPYFEVPGDESVWSATGYGTLRDDLVERVLRGDHSGRAR